MQSDFTERDGPLRLFEEWFAEAGKSEMNDPPPWRSPPVDADGLPDVRVVLMNGYDRRGFVFYTHRTGGRAARSRASLKAAANFHWKSLKRQVRLRGGCRDRQRRGSRRLFRLTAPRQPHRRLGEPAVAAVGEPRRLRGAHREVKGRYEGTGGAASAPLDWLPHRPLRDRVLARPAVPAACSRRLPTPHARRPPSRGPGSTPDRKAGATTMGMPPIKIPQNESRANARSCC